MIYLDYAATTPISNEALEAYTSVSRKYYGNSSSLHDYGSSAEQILKASAKAIAQTMGARTKDIHFTSGASEGSFLAIYSLLNALNKPGKHIITTEIEHSSVHNIFNRLQEEGYEVSKIPVGADTRIDRQALNDIIREDTVLASIQYVNSETGTIQDLAEIGAFLQKKGILVHTDAVQAYGKIPLQAEELNVDAISVSAHKIYGPKGTGAVWIHPNTLWKPVFPGEMAADKLKPGTSDIPSVAAFATAAKHTHQNIDQQQQQIEQFRTTFLNQLDETGISYSVEGHPRQRVPHILGLRFPGMEGQFFMLECNQAGLAISTGSACQVGSEQPNSTMLATGKSGQEAREFVRLSFGKYNQAEQIPEIIGKMNTILKRHYQKSK
ncbi:MAG: aminotransferase class V-fold PLP-dependent enzyme [Balneolaceae bacterium]|nr:aminotransferase class V-fold PLP-dependent enzyme [Balneolaceae bacterium]